MELQAKSTKPFPLDKKFEGTAMEVYFTHKSKELGEAGSKRTKVYQKYEIKIKSQLEI